MNSLYVICGLGFLSLLAEIFHFKKFLTPAILTGLALAVFLAIKDWNSGAHYYHDMVIFDNTALGFTALLLLTSIAWFWMAWPYFEGQLHQTDRAALILFATSGAVVLTSFNNMAMLFLGIEILSISLYVLAGSRKESLLSNEASFKYFLLGSFATGFLLMGIALIYGATGSFDLGLIAQSIGSKTELPGFMYAGVLLILVGMAFKISAVPFHFWAPDVYDGAPVPITAFMATVVKIGAVAAFCRMFSTAFPSLQATWLLPMEASVVLTLLIPTVTAVFQTSVKRMLAYSSVGQIGYLLLAFISAPGDSGMILYYLASYSIASIAAFTVLYEIEKTDGINPSFQGLFKRSPILAISMTVALLSLAGIPPLAGFMAKYLVFARALDSGYTGLVLLGVFASLVGVYYYLRLIGLMYSTESPPASILVLNSVRILLIGCAILLILLGVFPESLFSAGGGKS